MSSGIPTPTYDVPCLPERAPTTHKGQAGHVAIVAGSRGMTGAAVLSGLGALRGGAGLVRIYCPESVQPIIAAAEPCLMTVPLRDRGSGHLNVKPLASEIDAEWANVCAIGPGLGVAPSTAVAACVAAAICFKAPLVLDADMLNMLAGEGEDGKKCDAFLNMEVLRQNVNQNSGHYPIVLTPHPGEMARLRRASGLDDLGGDDDETRLRCAHEFAVKTDTIVVLKGHRTVVCTTDRAFINTTGNPGMATGGMGDVLTGLLAALIAQGMEAFDAACLAVHVHGLAADYCTEHIGPIGYLARDVADALPSALRDAGRGRIGYR